MNIDRRALRAIVYLLMIVVSLYFTQIGIISRFLFCKKKSK